MYCTAAELRTQMEKVGTTGAGADAALELIIEGVSQMIDRFFNREEGWFVALGAAEARIYPGSGKAHQRIDECVEITLVAVKDSATDTTYTSWASTDWIAFAGDPAHPNFNRLPYTGIMIDPGGDYSIFTDGYFSGRSGFRLTEDAGRTVPTVQVTAKWGYTKVCPPVIKQATIALATRWFKQGQGAWTDTLASPELGGLIYKAENADIKQMLEQTRFHKPAIG